MATWSPDLSSCDFYLLAYPKGIVYKNDSQMLDKLKENVWQEIARIPVWELQEIFLNMIHHAELYIVAGDEFLKQRL